MKIFLFLWIVIGGVDHGPPPIEMRSMEACRKVEAEWNAKAVPDGVDGIAVGCVTERKPEVKL
jgi:hypothetical protein